MFIALPAEDSDEEFRPKLKRRRRALFDEKYRSNCGEPSLEEADSKQYILDSGCATPSAVKKFFKEDTPLPDPFPLPTNFRSDVHACLNQKKMTKSARAAYFTAVASAMFQFKRYPSRDDFVSVAREIVGKYPFLGSVGLGTTYVRPNPCTS